MFRSRYSSEFMNEKQHRIITTDNFKIFVYELERVDNVFNVLIINKHNAAFSGEGYFNNIHKAFKVARMDYNKGLFEKL